MEKTTVAVTILKLVSKNRPESARIGQNPTESAACCGSRQIHIPRMIRGENLE